MRRRRLLAASLFGAAYAAYRWQPVRKTLLPCRPSGDERVDPETDRLFRPGTRVTIVTAHPDDTEFYLGGTLLQLRDADARLCLIVTTDGNKAYRSLRNRPRIARTRCAEQRAAAQAWNAEEVVFLGCPDGRVRATSSLIERITKELTQTAPEYVFLFEPRYLPPLWHQDHQQTGLATEAAMRQAGVGRWALYFATGAPNYVRDVTPHWPERLGLLRMHPSEWQDRPGYRRLRLVQRLITADAERDGARIGVPYGEGLRCVRIDIT